MFSNPAADTKAFDTTSRRPSNLVICGLWLISRCASMSTMQGYCFRQSIRG